MCARLLLISCGALWFFGCPGNAGPVDGGEDAGQIEIDAGPFAYDARPANPTCIAPAPPPGLSAVTTQRAFTNLSFNQPLGMFQAPGEASRIFIMEREGRIQVFPNQANAMPGDVQLVLDITGRVNTNGEGGLLGLAFHPNWPTTREVFLSYTADGAGGAPLRSTISRFRSTDNGLTLDPNSEEKVLELDQPYANHNGGGIGFGPDGFLYIGFGDGGSGGDPQNRAQRLNTNHGKFLRIDVNVPFIERFRIPADNPYAADNTPCNKMDPAEEKGPMVRCAEIYAVGLRNPWRWSFDPVSGDLWAGDVGQGLYEEVDLIVRGGNYGWKVREGLECYGGANCATVALDGTPFTDPVIHYPRADGNSITGGYVYRGARIPALVGRLIYGDYGSGKLFVLEPTAAGGWNHVELQDTNIAVASFGQLLDGEVYALDIASGQLHQFVPMGMVQPDTFPRRLSQTGCFDATNPRQPVPAMIPYDLNTPFWSDGAAKERHFAIPDGSKITVGSDGDFDFPNGTVISKTFTLAGKRIETRLFMRHSDGTWAGYSYEWDDAETDATLLPAGKLKNIGGQNWLYPSRAQCMQCHTATAGRTLGPEIAQLNRSIRYPVGATRHQLTVLDGLGFLSAPLTAPVEMLPKLEPIDGMGTVELRARSWLHSNCSVCHRNGAGQGPADFRFSRTFRETNTCNVMPDNGSLGVMGARLIVPGVPAQSLVSLRTHALDAARMPPLASLQVDVQGTQVVDDWIRSLTSCPP